MNIAITGATGTVGVSLIEALLKTDINSIIAISRDEYKTNLLKRKFDDKRVKWENADIRDKDDMMKHLFDINVVVHAAALKHVCTGQENPESVVKTNILGTENVINACKYNCIDKLIYISTDKAVEPNNVYGMTKYIAERMVLNEENLNTCVIRSGNIFGSRGSAIPSFKDLKRKGKKVHLTDVRMRRWFISKKKLTELIIHVINNGDDKSIYIPRMNLIRIVDIIKKLGCKYEVIGARDGEKLVEKLFLDHEKPIDCGWYYLL